MGWTCEVFYAFMNAYPKKTKKIRRVSQPVKNLFELWLYFQQLKLKDSYERMIMIYVM